jgi:stage II sporulation protein D
MTPHLRSSIVFRTALCAAGLVLVSLASPVAARADSIFSVSGRGWGHGIGMTQYGAMGYAQQGKTYDWILAHYFQQTDLATRVELTVKVDLDAAKAARSSWRIAAASAATTLTVTDLLHGAHSVEVTRGVSVWVTFKAGGAVLSSDKVSGSTHAVGSVIATFPAAVTAATGPIGSSKVTIQSTSGPYSESGIAWRGQIRFTPNTTTGHAIDYVPMEQYVQGVVPNESPSGWPAEALRAQAVAARSYAYEAALDSSKTLWCTTQSQMYRGATHEATSTNAAVLATANEYVVYVSNGVSKVVQTFFSSSSGGRTANIEDVWLGSTPRPYYTSVADADNVGGNPNYRWTLADMTGTAMAGKIRTHYASLAQASPATIKAVTLDAGPSGFIRHVTLHWSKGANTTLTGPQFQHALSLKSSAFAVKLKNPPPPPATRFQDTDARPLWAGAWQVVKNASGSGGSYHRSNAAGATWTVMFKGTTVAWIGTKTDHAGQAEVSLDGTRVATVDLYSSSTKYKVALWSKTALAADATHTLVVRVLGKHRSGSAGSYVYGDAVDVLGTLVTVPRPPAWKRYQQNVAAAKYSGVWKTSALAGLSGGTHAFSRETSAAVVYTFSGTGVRWIGKRAANYGKAWVSVDGATPKSVDLYSAKSLYQQRLFVSPGLAAGTHTLTIRVAGKKNAKATGYYVDIDAFDALQPVK